MNVVAEIIIRFIIWIVSVLIFINYWKNLDFISSLKNKIYFYTGLVLVFVIIPSLFFWSTTKL